MELVQTGDSALSVQLEQSLGVTLPKSVGENISKVLLDPVLNFLDRPSKKIRGTLVEMGAALGGGASSQSVRVASVMVEALHAGSLIVDDIQDESQIRRGEPCLHRSFGVPVALNAGNWLYFWTLEQVRQLGVPEAYQLNIFEWYRKTLLRAHLGQALDVGTQIDQIERDRVSPLCLTSLRLKSGSLTSFGLVLGALLTEEGPMLMPTLDNFGQDFGIALQMFDDIGNVRGEKDPTKKWEDFLLRRPTWFWAWMADHEDASTYVEFKRHVLKLPDSEGLNSWFSTHGEILERCYSHAISYLDSAHERLEAHFKLDQSKQGVCQKLRDLGRKVANAYQ